MSDERNDPLVLFIREEDRYIYESLRSQGPIRGISNTDLFVLAVAYGFYKGSPVSITGKKGDWTRVEYLNGKQKDFIKSIVIFKSDNLEAIADKKLVYALAEEYANSGIKILKANVFSNEPGSFEKRLEAELKDIADSVVGG